MHHLPTLPSSAAFITFVSLVACGHEELPSARRAATAPSATLQPSGASALSAPRQAATTSSDLSTPTSTPSTSTRSKQPKGFPELKRLVVAKHVENREPVGDGPLTARQPLVAFLEFSNPSSSPLSVQVTFEHEGGTRVGFVELGIPAHSLRYRTWARSHNIGLPGNWSAVVRDDSGEEVDRQAFFVEPAG